MNKNSYFPLPLSCTAGIINSSDIITTTTNNDVEVSPQPAIWSAQDLVLDALPHATLPFYLC